MSFAVFEDEDNERRAWINKNTLEAVVITPKTGEFTLYLQSAGEISGELEDPNMDALEEWLEGVFGSDIDTIGVKTWH